MAVRTSNGTGGGNYGTGATWAGGIAPVEGDSVVIASTDTVTVDGTYTAGDDTTTAFTVNGVLKFSRSVNSSLTVKGQIFTASTTTATIDMGRRSTADPIPSGVTATLILNKSASMSDYKYGLFIAEASNFYACGATRTVNTVLTADMAVSATSADVADITGWTVGDKIVFASSDGNVAHYESVTLTSITPGTGTTGTIGWSGGTSYTHGTGCPVGNMSSNVTIQNYNTSNYTFVCLRHTTTASNNRREVDYVNFRYAGSNSANTTTQSFITGGNTTNTVTPFVTFTNCSFYNANKTNSIFVYLWASGGFDISGHGFFTDNGQAGQQLYVGAGSYLTITDCVFYYGGNGYTSTQSEGGQGVVLTNCTFCSTGTGTALLNQSNGDGLQVINCKFHTVGSGQALAVVRSGTAQFTGCLFGSSALWGTPAFGYIMGTGQSNERYHYFQVTHTDCYYGTPVVGFYLNVDYANPSSVCYISNKNVDPSVQEIYTPAGTIARDNNSKISGVTSLKMSPTSSTSPLTFILYVPAPTGKKVGVSGYLWRDTANTTTVTLSGPGITPSVYTASGSLSANEQFFVSGTQTTGTDGFLTLTFSTTGTSGNLWVDSISAPQASAIDFGEFGFWANGLPAQIVTANTVSAGDVWNYLTSNISVSGSIGVVAKKALTVAKFLALK